MIYILAIMISSQLDFRDERVLMRTESLLQGMGRNDYLKPTSRNGKGTLRVSV